ncbi:MAG: hypothetical protein AAF633_12080 [Chloroflexota bacterium]
MGIVALIFGIGLVPLAGSLSAAPLAQVCGDLEQEAESGMLIGDFRVVIDQAASAGAYVEVPEGTAVDDPTAHGLELCFRITQAGSYQMYGVVSGNGILQDSFFVKVNDAPAGDGYLWDFPENGTFGRDLVNDREDQDPVLLNLAPGDYVVRLQIRETRAKIDTFGFERVGALTTTPTISPLTPTATGKPTDTSTPTNTPSPTSTATPAATQSLVCNGLEREAEDGRLFGDFDIVADSNARNGEYVLASASADESNPTAHGVELCFTVSDPGQYRLLSRAKAGNGNEDSFFVQINGEPSDAVGYAWRVPLNSGNFIEDYVSGGVAPYIVDPVVVELPVGEQVVTVMLRETLTGIDWLRLEKVDSTPTPTATNTPTATSTATPDPGSTAEPTPTASSTSTPSASPTPSVTPTILTGPMGPVYLPMVYENPDIFPTATPVPSATPAPQTCLASEREPNNISAQVDDLPICFNQDIQGTLSVGSDIRDFYFIELDQPGSLLATMTGVLPGNQFILALYDGNGVPIYSNGEETLNKNLVARDLPVGFYFVGVYIDRGAGADQPYTLRVSDE